MLEEDNEGPTLEALSKASATKSFVQLIAHSRPKMKIKRTKSGRPEEWYVDAIVMELLSGDLEDWAKQNEEGTQSTVASEEVLRRD